MIFTIDKADTTREATRKIIVDFFKKFFGFTDNDIIFVDRTEFIRDLETGIFKTQFSAQTKEEMKKFARSIFEDTQFGLANQILHIVLCECQGEEYDSLSYFKLASNVELTIMLTDAFTEANAREYFDCLA